MHGPDEPASARASDKSNTAEDMDELWLQASEAHVTLSDAAKRREYNHTSHAEYVRRRKMALISEQERLARRGTSAGYTI